VLTSTSGLGSYTLSVLKDLHFKIRSVFIRSCVQLPE